MRPTDSSWATFASRVFVNENDGFAFVIFIIYTYYMSVYVGEYHLDLGYIGVTHGIYLYIFISIHLNGRNLFVCFVFVRGLASGRLAFGLVNNTQVLRLACCVVCWFTAWLRFLLRFFSVSVTESSLNTEEYRRKFN